MLILRPANQDDCIELAKTLRQADIEEIKAATGSTPVAALKLGRAASALCRVVVNDTDTPVAMFGVYEFCPFNHTVWMLASNLIHKHRLDFLRQSRTVVDTIAAKFPGKMCNYVDSRNTLHHQWLRWCGFTIYPEQFTILRDPQVPFYYFERSNQNV